MPRSLALALSAAAVICLFLLVAAFSPTMAQEAPRSISVSGQGKVMAKPDQATIQVGVTTTDKTASQAMETNNAQMMAVFEAMAALGIEDKNIQTSNFSVNPRYDYNKSTFSGSGGRSKVPGYQVSNTVRITVKDLDALGDILDRLVTVGANQVNGIYFGFDDASKLQDQARVKAVENTHAKATLLASSAGATLGDVMYIQEGGASVPRPMMARMEMSSPRSAIPIASGENAITAAVNITYALK